MIFSAISYSLIILVVILRIDGFHLFHQRRHLSQFKASKVEDGVSLIELQNFQKEASFLGDRVKVWLDSEYIPQDVHRTIAETIKECYMVSRKKGVNDLGELILNVGNRIEEIDIRDSFVHGWDIANKIGDLVLILLDRELCSCAGNMASDYKAAIEYGLLVNKILESSNSPIINRKEYNDLVRKYSQDFHRYSFFQNFLDGNCSINLSI
jgi:hypothetical protein